MSENTILNSQLARMRGMTKFYHEQFFADIRSVTVFSVGLFLLGWWEIPEAFLLVPVVSLLGANQTALDASYLMMARHYSARIENQLNESGGKKLLLGSILEDKFLFPLDRRKLVTVRIGGDFTWFGWMTILFTVMGSLAFVVGLAAGWSTLIEAGRGWTTLYLTGVLSLLAGSIVIGTWWFFLGAGERRLNAALDEFGEPTAQSRHS